MSEETRSCELIVTIVNKGMADEVLDASRASGAQGATILPGRGAGSRVNSRLLGIPIEPEKDVVLILIERERTKTVLTGITRRLNLTGPGTGIAFVVPVSEAVGITFEAAGP